MTDRPSDELVARMVELVRDLHADHLRHDMHDRAQDFCKRTAAIVAELPPPVDPDLEEAREIWARNREEQGSPNTAALYRRGDYDNSFLVTTTLAALKRGREIERGAR